MRAWMPFRYAGGLSLVVLLGLGVAGALLLPGRDVRRPASPEAVALAAHPDYPAIQAYLQANAGAALVRCAWPPNLQRGGRVDGLPGAWLDPGLALATPAGEGGAPVVGADGAPHAWIAWRAGRCAVYRPATVRVDGRVVDAQGAARGGATVSGCGTSAVADPDGAFQLDLGPDALLAAARGSGPPRCALAAGGPSTPVALDAAAVVPAIVQVDR